MEMLLILTMIRLSKKMDNNSFLSNNIIRHYCNTHSHNNKCKILWGYNKKLLIELFPSLYQLQVKVITIILF